MVLPSLWVPESNLSSKRPAASTAAGDARGTLARRMETTSSNPVAEELDPQTWQPWFHMADETTPQAGTNLISPAENLFQELSSRLPEYEVLQVFLKFKCNKLCAPVGALPTVVAPVRVSLAKTSEAKFVCLGRETRAGMKPERCHTCSPNSCDHNV